jgi:hypothetical protein
MKRLLLALAALAPLAACGPDCDKFCRHWVTDCGNGPGGAGVTGATDLGQCLQGCNEVGSDNAAFISCVADKSCQDIQAGHCQIPTVAPGIVQ